jgi:hypothetical protein
MVFAVAALLVSLGIIVLELFCGFALIGWTGDRMLVERAKSPGPIGCYVFSSVVQYASLTNLDQLAIRSSWAA